MNNQYLELSGVGIEFRANGKSFRALRDVNLKIGEGEFVTLIGHSGCGKSTVLNIIAGLHLATEGGAILEGKEVTEPGPERAVVFQNHSLMPWLSVYDNVALAVDQVFRKTRSRAERREWVEHNLRLVNMEQAMKKLPGEISGGMKQRVGIARALAMQPKVLLMDEPFGALDALTRAQLQDSLMRIHADLRCTVVMITHDVDEAVLLSDRIVMMTNGPAATIGEVLPVELERPRDRLELAEDPAFVHLRQQVLQFLYAKHRRAEPGAQAARAPSGDAPAAGTPPMGAADEGGPIPNAVEPMRPNRIEAA